MTVTAEGSRTIPVRNPYTGEFDYAITPPTPQELARTCANLRAAQVKWAADEHLADAVAKGAVIAAGGPAERLGGGWFMRPTVLTEVNHDMLLMREESFAPFLLLMRYHTEDEAVELANDTHYGLSASVIAGTPEEAARIGERVNAGTVALQDTFLTLFKTRDIGTNSFGDSGLGGDRTGPGSILRFLRKKALMTQSAPPAPLSRPGRPA
jgi:succinate-semialdehyde dehydrogenase / glutarate-semialdehyde dehydrogenase